jgi:hypothetical protein
MNERETMTRCPSCNLPVKKGVGYCPACGRAVDRSGTPPATEDPGKSGIPGAVPDPQHALVWTNRIRFLDRIILRGMIWILPLSVGIFALLLVVMIPLTGGNLQEMVGGLGFLLLLTLGILTLLVLVSAVLLHLMTGGGYDATFAVTGEGVGFFGGEKMKKVNEALVIGSLLTASPGPAGAALVNYGSDRNFIAWKDIRSMKVLEKDRYILIRPRWLVNPIPLYCTEQNYPQVLSLIRHHRPDLA